MENFNSLNPKLLNLIWLFSILNYNLIQIIYLGDLYEKVGSYNFNR